MYIYSVNVLINDDENLVLESQIDSAINNILNAKGAELVSANIEDLVGKNYGRCSLCGSWCSNPEKENYVRMFSVGDLVNGKWYCDVCLPSTHKYAF